MDESDNIHAEAQAAFESLTGTAESAPEPAPTPPPPTPTPAQSEAKPLEVPAPAQAASIEKSTQVAPQPGRDEKGRFLPGATNGARTVAPKPEATAKTPEPQAPAGTEAAAPQPGATDVSKPPVGFGPLARAKWEATPVEVREDIWQREKSVSQALRASTEARQFHDAWQKVSAPYEAMFRAEGVDHLTGIQNLLQSMAVLHGPMPSAKAAIVASIIKNYGAPIEGVLQLLGVDVKDGQLSAAQPQVSSDWAQAQQHISQLQQRISDMEAQRAQAGEQWAKGHVADFRRMHEFYDDLKDDIAKLYSAGYELEEAYELAAYRNPQTRKLVQEKEAQAQLQQQQAQAQKAKAASASVRSAPVATPRAPVGDDHYSEAAAAYQELLARG
jgi:hypothetical protein